MVRPPSILVPLVLLCATAAGALGASEDEPHHQRRVQKLKLDLWLHGAYSFPTSASTAHEVNDAAALAAALELQAARAPIRHGPVREVRQRLKHELQLGDDEGRMGGYHLMGNFLSVRGGDDGGIRLEKQLEELSAKFGTPFFDAIEQVRFDIVCGMCNKNHIRAH